MNDSKKESLATLRICSTVITAKEIQNILNVVPDRSCEKGDLISKRSPKPSYMQHAMCLYESKLPDTEPMEAHLEKILLFIEKKMQQLKLLQQNCDIDIFCMYSTSNGQGGITVTKEVLQRLVQFPIDVTFDLYLSE
jgi:hypothetical protein